MSLSVLFLAAACSSPPAGQDAAHARAAATVSGATSIYSRNKPISQETKPIHVLVELTEQPTALKFAGRLQALRGTTTSPDSVATADATQAAVSQLAIVRSEQRTFAERVAATRIPGTTEVYRLQRVYNGIVYVTDAAGMAKLQAVPGGRSVHVLSVLEPDNSATVPFLGVPAAFWSAATPLHGETIKVGVIDTGIDYTHANFGGAGTTAAYLANNPDLVEAGTFPTAKVVGGWDFAGHTYNAASAATSVPFPDADPIDGSGHGSHVAGTIAGLGVNVDGTPYAGSYDLSLNTAALRIGPGAAPRASLYALKVFGDGGGSTSLAALAMEWATDPNGDGDFSDHLDVVNLSLGSTYGNSSDADAVIYANAVAAGVSVVASAGNAGDFNFVTGAPASTPAVISVAASEGNALQFDVLQENSPNARNLPAGKGSPMVALAAPLSGTLVLAQRTGTGDLADGCTALTNAAAVAGNVALINRGTCNFALKAANAQAAGAIGFVIANLSNSAWPISMALDATITIPGRIIRYSDGVLLKTDLAAGAVTVTFDDTLNAAIAQTADTVASFSSRGPSRQLDHVVLKPDVTAPGVSILSTGMGTGYAGAVFSGTSMASPLTAGVVALLRQQHPGWSPAEIKALLMNTAGHDTYTAITGRPANRVSPARAGAGRIDALTASSGNVIAFDKVNPERVSVTFATTDVVTAATETRTVRLKNKGAVDVTYDVTVASSVAPPGATVTAGATQVTVAAGAATDLPVSLAVDPAALVRTRDASMAATTAGGLTRNWLSEASGYLVLTPRTAGPVLRVPYYAAPTPASAMRTTTRSLVTSTTPSGSADLALTGTGVDTQALAAVPKAVVSMATPFELAYASPRGAPVGGPLPTGVASAETDNANLRYVGVTSNLADLPGATDFPEIYFAVSTYGLWGSPAEVEFDVYLRRAGAPDWEYVLYNGEYGRTSANPATDAHVTNLVNLATGTSTLEDLVASGDAVPVMLTDTMILPVFPSDFLTGPGTAIEYQVVTFSSAVSGPIDMTPVLRYDYAAPAFSTTIDTLLPALAPAGGYGNPPMRKDMPAATFTVQYNLDRAKATQTGAMLLVHNHNSAGLRPEVVTVTGLTCTSNAACAGTPATPVCDTDGGACVGCVTDADCIGSGAYCDAYGTRTCLPTQPLIEVSTEAPGANCAAGGVGIATGYDTNHNGVLDATEATATKYVCNGLSATVTPEGSGTNCAQGGVKVQVGSGAATYVCNGAAGADGLSATVTAEAAGSNCATGGVKVQVGSGTPNYVCNGATGAAGATGADGQSAVVTPEAAGGNCTYGGLKVQVAGGTPAYVCDGAPGTTGQSATVTPEAAGSNCATGGLKVQVGTDPASYVCNGATGAGGPTGPTGPGGAVGPAGPKGSSGCSSVGGGTSAFSLIGLGALLWRRRRQVRPVTAR